MMRNSHERYYMDKIKHMLVSKSGMKKICIGVLLGVSFYVEGCYYDVVEDFEEEAPPCDTEAVSFSEEVLSILNTHCNGCHDEASSFGGITLDNHADVQKAANNGSLLGTIRHESAFSVMPPDGSQLVKCEIDQISSWIDAGTEDN